MPATEAAALIATARRWPAPGPGRVEPLAPGSSHRLFAAVLAGEPVVVKVFRDDVTPVDFEDSGLNLPAVELADLVEHVANRGLPEATVGRLGHLWGLARRGAGLAEARRLAACFWLVVLERNRRAGLPARQVTAAQQAARVQELLG
jgi:hypothetical protein